MDDETFVNHMNARHMPIAGISHLSPVVGSEWVQTALWRSWHRWLHKRGLYQGKRLNHFHQEDE